MHTLIRPKIFWQAYIPIFLSFVTSRLILQTDLLMVSPLGEAATAAFAVPSKIMIIDSIVAIALGPVISIAISRETSESVKCKLIASALGLTCLISCALTLIGLMIYPHFVSSIITNPVVEEMSQNAVFWMTLSIPIRMLIFVGGMCLFACGEGKRVSKIYFITISLNALLDWLFIYTFSFGFVGAYLATVLVSTIELVWILYLIVKKIRQFPLGRVSVSFVCSLATKFGPEWVRLISWQLEGFAILAILASQWDWFPALSLFGVSAEVTALLTMPLVAMMRNVSMVLAEHYKGSDFFVAKQLLKSVTRDTVLAYIFIGMLVFVIGMNFGPAIYKLDSDRLVWWNAFIPIFSISLPFFAYGSLVRGIYQACGKFKEIASIEIVITWILFIPALYYALTTQNPFVFFAILYGKEIIILSLLRFKFLHD